MDEETVEACCQVIQERIDQMSEARPDAEDEDWVGMLDYGIAQLEGVRWSIQQLKRNETEK